MRELGVGAYRFSVSWPRVLPDGTGAVNPAGLAFYDRLVDALLEAGIRPFVTVYHWDLPQVLQDRGGWPARDTAHALAEYAGVVGAALGDRVQDWFTVNEPLCSAWIGHLEGRMAPGEQDIARAVPAAHHLLLGHGLAVQALRAAAPGARVGAVVNLSPCEPASADAGRRGAARRADGHTNRWWLDPLHGRGYPADMVEVYGVEPPVRGRRPGDHRRPDRPHRAELLLPPGGHRRPDRPAAARPDGRRCRTRCTPTWTGRCTRTGWSSC